MASTSSTSRAAVRSMASSLTASRASSPAVARSALAFAARSPASVTSRRALSSNTRFQQFPRLQSLNTLSSKRTFATTGRMAAESRTESDAFGEIQVPGDKYWGAQTQRSLGNFDINQPQDRMPEAVIKAIARVNAWWIPRTSSGNTMAYNGGDLLPRCS